MNINIYYSKKEAVKLSKNFTASFFSRMQRAKRKLACTWLRSNKFFGI